MAIDKFTPIPSRSATIDVVVAATAPTDEATGFVVGPSGATPAGLALTRAQLDAAGYAGKAGHCHVVSADAGQVMVAVGLEQETLADLRDAAATFARAAAHRADLAFVLPPLPGIEADAAAHAVVEGVLLARYRYDALRRASTTVALRRLTVVAPPESSELAAAGAARGHVFASATMLARDLANTPHSHLTAVRFADLAVQLGAETGVDVEVFDEGTLRDMGIGGLLAINAGSAQPPRMIKLTYRPPGEPTGRLAVVGKGVMYDSGGISLKPSDRVHAQMKNDMSGAAAALAAITSLPALGCTTAVTGYLMCTDNMPSGTATGLGDVITIRGGTTMEMIDTDAEGRVIMADALVLAGEDGHDGVVDIATLTGSAMRALGTDLAAIFGNHPEMVDQVKAASAATDELVWELPLHRPYRSKIDSLVADIANCAPIGQPDALLAALLLAEFVGDVPWAHIDMCGQAQNDVDRTWHPEGCTGYGARLLLQFALDFRSPTPRD